MSRGRRQALRAMATEYGVKLFHAKTGGLRGLKTFLVHHLAGTRLGNAVFIRGDRNGFEAIVKFA